MLAPSRVVIRSALAIIAVALFAAVYLIALAVETLDLRPVAMPKATRDRR